MSQILRIVLILVPLLQLVASVPSTFENFSELCREETKLKRKFDEFGLDRQAWNAFQKNRKSRQLVGIDLGLQNCSQVAQADNEVLVIGDMELLEELCVNEKRVADELATCRDPIVRRYLEILHSEAEWIRKDFKARTSDSTWTNECPPNVQLAEAQNWRNESIAASLRRSIDENCEREIFWGYLRDKIVYLRERHDDAADELDGLERVADEEHSEAVRRRHKSCQDHVTECCEPHVVEEAMNGASYKAAQTMLKVVDGWLRQVNDEFQKYDSLENLNGTHKALCELEHKTGAGKQYYKARSATLKTLKYWHKEARKYRDLLGLAIGKRSCSKEAMKALVPNNAGLDLKEVKMDPNCAREVKAQLVCQALEKIENKGKYHQEFYNLHYNWCTLNRQLQEEKVSASKAYKAPKCTDEMREAIADDANVEVEVTLEALRLRQIAERAHELHGRKQIRRKVVIKLLGQIKSVFKRDYRAEADGTRREQSRLAYQLLKDRLGELKKET